jgi:hypothetical protein
LVFFRSAGDLAYKKIFEDQQLLKIGADYGPNYQRIKSFAVGTELAGSNDECDRCLRIIQAAKQ